MELEKEKVEIPGTSTEHVDAVSITGGVPERPKGTKRMMLLGLYVGLTGWMYNFDLGKLFAWVTASYTQIPSTIQTLNMCEQATVASCSK